MPRGEIGKREHQVSHAERAPTFRRCISGGHRNISDRAAGQLERSGQEIQIEVISARHCRPQTPLPELPAVLFFGLRKVN